MKNKGINPLFISALDILTGALGAFIVLNFLNSLTPADAPKKPDQKETVAGAEQKDKPKQSKQTNPAQPNTYTGWWRKPPGNQNTGKYDTPPNNNTGKYPTEGPTSPSTVSNNPDPNPKPAPTEQNESSPKQDPVSVDLMKQTQGVVVILLQQADRSKTGVEMMLKQGNRTWKPSRASKYQDNTFAYQKGYNYFYQKDLSPGSYEVLVRVKKGEKESTPHAFNLYGKLAPTGAKTQTYSFGRFTVGGAQTEWESAGTLTVTAAKLSYFSRLSTAPEIAASETNSDKTPAPTPPSPAVVQNTPAKKKGKWD